jgi:hypothetical protein
MIGEQLSLPFPSPASGPPLTRTIAAPSASGSEAVTPGPPLARPIAAPSGALGHDAPPPPDTAEPTGLAGRALDPRLRPSHRRRRRLDDIRNGVLAEVIPIESEVRQRAGLTHAPATGDLPPCA